MRALVVGGTGPTGPHIVEGLLAGGYETSIFHRGTHEVPGMPAIEHIHGDPHFPESIADALRGRFFDVVVALYGRTRYIADALAGRCDLFLGVGGVAVYPGAMQPDSVRPHGMRVLSIEDDAEPALLTGTDSEAEAIRLIRSTEAHVLRLHEAGAFHATWFRYPLVYGPRQVVPIEWSVVRRILDGRPFIILPDGGLTLFSRIGARNAAHAILLAVEQPDRCEGRMYNVAEDGLYTLRQWVETIASVMSASIDIESLPIELATPAAAITRTPYHVVVDAGRIRRELGYRDIRSFAEGIQETVEWYMEHPIRSVDYPAFTDRFDYKHEDTLVTAYHEMESSLRRIAGSPPPFVHPYAHPREAGRHRDEHDR